MDYGKPTFRWIVVGLLIAGASYWAAWASSQAYRTRLAEEAERVREEVRLRAWLKNNNGEVETFDNFRQVYRVARDDEPVWTIVLYPHTTLEDVGRIQRAFPGASVVKLKSRCPDEIDFAF